MTEPIKLNRKLVLEEAQLSADGAGGQIQTWVALGTLWASISAGTGREQGRQHLTVSTVPYRIVVRAAPEGAPERPRPDQRFREGNRVFRILAVTEHDRQGHFLVCYAREEVLA